MNIKRYVRKSVQAILNPFLRWGRPREIAEGYSIILGAPWNLRHLLRINLLFLSKTDLTHVRRVLVVFDRTRREGANDFVDGIKREFASLPLAFYFHPTVPGGIVRIVNQSKFYASLNWVTGIKNCPTRYAILHDFDLYPLQSDFFRNIFAALKTENLCFCGAEYTHWDGLTDEDRILGTWELGMDADWLRNTCKPIDCFHKYAPIGGRLHDVDAFSYIQSRTPERALVHGANGLPYCHVTNLCSTFLRLTKGEKVNVAWRLHTLWYLESLPEDTRRLRAITEHMNAAKSPVLTVNNRMIDFSTVHVTCANVLDRDLMLMENFLYGSCRDVVREYVDAFSGFLRKHGDRSEL